MSAGCHVVNRDSFFRVFEQNVREKLGEPHHLSVVKHDVVNIPVQNKHRRLAAQITTPQVFGPRREISRFTHTSRSFKPIGFSNRSVSAAVCLIDSTPSSNSSNCPVNSCGDCIVTI